MMNPLEGTGINLQSIDVLKGIGQNGTFETSDIVGLLGGGALGFLVAKRWPHSIIKWIGVLVGAELGVILVRVVKSSIISRRIGAK